MSRQVASLTGRTALVLLGLAGSAGPLAGQQPAGRVLVWPPAPEVGRIQYVGSLRSESDIHRRQSLLGRIGRWLTGSRGRGPYPVQRPFDVLVADGNRFYLTNGSLPAVVLFDGAARQARLLGQDVPGGLAKPMGLGADPAGNIYVTDAGRRRVVVLGPDGRFVRALGGSTILLNPVDVASDGERIWVVDSYLHQVVVLDQSGVVIGRIGREAGTLQARDSARLVTRRTGSEGHGEFVPDVLSDVWQNRGGGPGEFRYPVAVALGPDGTVYVSDQLNFRVQAFDRDGHYLRQLGGLGDTPGTFTRPKGVAVDGEGHVYVVDAAFNNVQVFDSSGRLLLAFGQFGRGEGEFWLPLGITIDRANRIYVADRYNNRLQIYQYLQAPDSVGSPPGGGDGR